MQCKGIWTTSMIVLVIQKKPTFSNLMQFVEREEDSKSSDFAFQLMAREKPECRSKSSGGRGKVVVTLW